MLYVHGAPYCTLSHCAWSLLLHTIPLCVVSPVAHIIPLCIVSPVAHCPTVHAWSPLLHTIPLCMVSPVAHYPTVCGLPCCTLSHCAWSPLSHLLVTTLTANLSKKTHMKSFHTGHAHSDMGCKIKLNHCSNFLIRQVNLLRCKASVNHTTF